MSPAKRGVDIQPMIPIIHEKMPRISIPTPDQEAIQ
jgi:hypothetical protein